jgi:hypothetical protein
VALVWIRQRAQMAITTGTVAAATFEAVSSAPKQASASTMQATPPRRRVLGGRNVVVEGSAIGAPTLTAVFRV